LAFIVLARNQILKAGRFQAYAVSSQSRIGEGDNETVTSSEYDLAYYVDDVRHDLLAELRRLVFAA
jgi:hypothetical protein